jgi:hypothetical protein
VFRNIDTFPLFYIYKGPEGEGEGGGEGHCKEVDIRVWSQAGKVSFEKGFPVTSLVSTCT